jgi:nucleoside-diphosphate-sugar epimerase
MWQARASNEKARTELGVEFTPLPDGVASTVRWMAESGRV